MNINQILRANPRPCQYGAPMGARSHFDTDAPRLYVQRVRMVDCCYGADGTYWGAGDNRIGHMYCGFNESSRVYVRAKNRAEALALILRDFPAATFYRGQ